MPRQEHDAEQSDHRNAFPGGEPAALAFIHEQLVGMEFPGQLDRLRFAGIQDLEQRGERRGIRDDNHRRASAATVLRSSASSSVP